MFITRNTARAVIVFMVIAVMYLCWTAMKSSECVSTGIQLQTRTTWAPVGGCVVPDGYDKPWTVITGQ